MAFDRLRSLSHSNAFPYRSVYRPTSSFSSCFSPLLLESLLPGVYRVFFLFFFRSSNFLFIFRTRQYPRTGPGVRTKVRRRSFFSFSSSVHWWRPRRDPFFSLFYFPNHITIFSMALLAVYRVPFRL